MDNASTKLAPVEHRVTFLGKDPVTKNNWRIRCECGWTEKCLSMHQGYSYKVEGVRYTLMLRWEQHVYTPEERMVLKELEGSLRMWGSEYRPETD